MHAVLANPMGRAGFELTAFVLGTRPGFAQTARTSLLLPSAPERVSIGAHPVLPLPRSTSQRATTPMFAMVSPLPSEGIARTKVITPATGARGSAIVFPT